MKDNLAIIGTQWGDEGKGKIVDLLAPGYDIVARFQGGNNAGHTINIDGKNIILHTIPSGVLHEKVVNVIGNGVVVNPDALLEEIDVLKQHGIDIKNRLLISDRAHLIMPYHLYRDKRSEKKLGVKKLGTTSRGIGPTYGDKILRRGLRAGYLVSEDAKDSIRSIVEANIERIKKLHDSNPLNTEKIMEEFDIWRVKLSGFIYDAAVYLYNSIKKGKKVLFEGAQGTMLDIDHGTYPYVTSSNSTVGGLSSGLGLGPGMIGSVLGICKAYATRVGSGPFPTELIDKTGDMLRKAGGEYGATTGRPRRCGWFDLIVARYAVRVNGLDYIAITKLDVLDGFETIKICTGYKYKSDIIKDFPADLSILDEISPVYKEFKGWQKPISGLTVFKDLPIEAQKYISNLEELMECPVALISTGPGREETIILNNTLI